MIDQLPRRPLRLVALLCSGTDLGRLECVELQVDDVVWHAAFDAAFGDDAEGGHAPWKEAFGERADPLAVVRGGESWPPPSTFGQRLAAWATGQTPHVTLTGNVGTGKHTMAEAWGVQPSQMRRWRRDRGRRSLEFATPRGLRIRMYDQAWHPEQRSLFYYGLFRARAVAFVVGNGRLERARSDLEYTLDKHAGPVLVLANMQDRRGAFTPRRLVRELDLEQALAGRVWACMGTCAKSGGGLDRALEWLERSVA